MFPYSIAVIAFLWWISVRWASTPRRARASRPPRVQPRVQPRTHETAQRRAPSVQTAPQGSRGWRVLADATFGVYLAHPLFMFWAMDHVIPYLPKGVPEPLLVVLVWTITVTGSSLLSIALMYTPVLSRLVGRATPLPAVLARPLDAVGARLRAGVERWFSPRGRTVTARAVAPPLWVPPHLRGAGNTSAAAQRAADSALSSGERAERGRAAAPRPERLERAEPRVQPEGAGPVARGV